MRLICLLGLLSAAAAGAAEPPFELGVGYSEWLDFAANSGAQLATDAAGSVYFLTSALQGNVALSSVTKLSADGTAIVWRNQLGFAASGMAVDPNGGVYVTPVRQQGDTSVFVAKLGANGSGLQWKTAAGFLPQSPPVLAADAAGRVYVAAQFAVNNFVTRSADVVRLNAAGSAVDYTTTISGTPTSIAVDASGAAYVAGSAVSSQGAGTGFLARLAPDGTAGYYSVLAAGESQTVAVDASGNVVLFGGNVVARVDAGGLETIRTQLAGTAISFALDDAGNAYVTTTTNLVYPVKNTLATCQFDPAMPQGSYSELLDVIAPSGSIAQATYIPGGPLGAPLVAATPDGHVFTVATAGPSFMPTQTGPFAAGSTGSLFLTKFAPGAGPVFGLACAGNSASLLVGAIAPGELVTLMGSGLGAAPDARVTFDDIPAPLLYVQDAQINLVAPWGLTPGRTTQVCASYKNVATSCLALPVVAAAPAVFTTDRRYAAALNQDGTYNSASNRAAPGSIVTVYATGLGPITPAQPDGSTIAVPLPTNDFAWGVEAIYTVGIPFGTEVDVPFEVLYAGPAPALVAGVSQINFRVAPYASYGAIYLHRGSTFSPGFSVYVAGQ